MKPSVFPHMVASLILGTIAPLSAQNLASTPSASGSKADAIDGISERQFSASNLPPGRYQVPVVAKTDGTLPDVKPVYAAQDAATLDPAAPSQQKVEAVVDLGVLREPSPYQTKAAGKVLYEVSTDGLQKGLATISAVYRETGKTDKNFDASAIALSVEQRVKLDPSKVLEVVQSEVSANPAFACEIVKASIKASEADVKQVVAIVETAINASPENMRLISQCAIASMPESVAEVQALLAKLDPNSGDSDVYSSKSAKSAKSAKVVIAPAVISNPLDLPPIYIIPPPPVIPPPVTEVNPPVCKY